MDSVDEENIEWLMQSSATVEQVVVDDAEEKLRKNEEKQLKLFQQILKEYFDNEPHYEGGIAYGVVPTDEHFQLLIRRLKALGYFFAIRTSRTHNQRKKLMIRPPKFPQQVLQPYVVDRQVNFYCSSGPEYNKQLKQRLQTSRRVNTDCKATMTARYVSVFVNVKVPKMQKNRLMALSKLRRDMGAGRAPFKSELWVSISLPRMHHHPLYLRGHHLDQEVNAAMHCLLQNGVKTKEEIQTHIRKVVSQEFPRGAAQPDADNSAFYPSLKVIYNHLRHEGLQRKKYQKKQKPLTAEELKGEIKMKLSQIKRNIEDCTDLTVLNQVRSIMAKVHDRLQPRPNLLPLEQQ